MRLRRSDFIEATYAFSFVLANFGIAIAARMPMMTTTIRSSIRVKPFFIATIVPAPSRVSGAGFGFAAARALAIRLENATSGRGGCRAASSKRDNDLASFGGRHAACGGSHSVGTPVFCNALPNGPSCLYIDIHSNEAHEYEGP